MQINNVVNSQFVYRQQNFKGNSANTDKISESPNYQSVPIETSKAYALPQITENYKEIETFDIPYIGKGKLYELANGHKVIIVPKSSKTYISTIVNAGFSDESAEKKEIAHLTEHLLANYWHNSDEMSDISKTLKEAGMLGNANTNDCFTSYHMSANIQDDTDLEKLMRIQLGTLTNNRFNENAVQKEKNIIIEEAKENGYFIKPDTIAYDRSISNLFNLEMKDDLVAEHSYNTILNINKDDLDKFYNDFYRPDNMTTIIIGNVDDKSIKVISKYLNKMIHTNSEIEKNDISKLKEDQYLNNFKRLDIESKDNNNKYWDFINLSFIGPQINDVKDSENIMVLNRVLKTRLKQQDLNLDTEIFSISSDTSIPQIISINGDGLKEKTEKNLKILYSTIDNILKNPISKEELAKAKDQIFEELSDNLEDNESLSLYLNDKLLSAPKMNVKSSLDNLNTISENDIQNVAKKYLNINKASLIIVHPNQESLKKNAEISFKGRSELIDTKDIKEYDLPNNLHVIFDTRPGIIKTAVSCDFLFQNNLNKGLIDAIQSSLSRDEDENFLAGNWVDYDGIHIRKFGASNNILNMINEIKENLVNPTFVCNELEKTKKEQLESFKQDKKVYATDLLLENNSTPQKKDEICPEWVQTKDLANYYNYLLSQSQGTIVITTPKEKLDEVEPEIIKSLSNVPKVKSHDFSKILNQFTPKELDKNTIFLDMQDYSNTVKIEKEYKIIHNGDIKDEASIILLTEILKNKLQKTLRTDLGLTYDAFSYTSKSSSKHNILTISTRIAKTPLDETTKTVLTQIDNIVNDLSNSKIDENIIRSMKKQVESNILIPAETSIDRNMNLESDYKKTYDINYSKKLIEALDSITSDDLQKVAQAYLSKPYVLEVSGNTKAIENNNDYLSKIGQIVI